MKRKWWIKFGLQAGRQEGGISRELQSSLNVKRYRKVLWKQGRKVIARQDLTPTEKIVFWAMLERFRLDTWSSHDAVAYYGLMTGLHRSAVSRAIRGLMEKGIILLVRDGEGEEGKLYESLERGGKRHFLFVGLAYEVGKAGRERATLNAQYLGERTKREAQEIGMG